LNLGYSRDFLSALVKVPTAVSALVLMGAAPFSGFLLKYLIVSLFASSSSFFTCLVILLSSAITHLAYFNLFTNITERVCKYSGRSNNE
jgi:formate hydrogenlyase subunit 3/multisubunit Na+/H+ antiporter MnhD subunit